MEIKILVTKRWPPETPPERRSAHYDLIYDDKGEFKAWEYFFSDGTGENLIIPAPERFSLRPEDVPVELIFTPPPTPDDGTQFSTEIQRREDAEECFREIGQQHARLGCTVVFPDRSRQRTGFPEFVPRSLTKHERLDSIQNGRSQQQFGCLTVFDDFNIVLCGNKPYSLTDSSQGRELLRFLCETEAFSEASGQKKADIYQRIKDTCGSVASDWRPAHVLRGDLKPLYEAAVGRNAKGVYWIKP